MIEAAKNAELSDIAEGKNSISKDQKLRQVCADFESLLVHYILKSGRKTLPGNDLFDNSHDSQIYKSMMDERLAIAVSEAKGIGLGEILYRQLGEKQAHSLQAEDAESTPLENL